MEYMTLTGTEDVARAGYAMRDAAAEMRRAAENMGTAMQEHQQFMDDWLVRFEQVLTTAVEHARAPTV